LAQTLAKDTTPEGKRLYGAVMNLSGAFSDLADDSGVVNGAYQLQSKFVNELAKQTEKWYNVVKEASSLLEDLNEEIDGSRDSSARISELWDALSSDIDIEQRLEIAGELKDLILDKYKLEKDNAEKLIEFGKDLTKYVKELKTGQLSPLTTGQKLAEAAQQYQATLANVNAPGKVGEDARSALQGKADKYLELAQTYYASSDAYTNIFNSVVSQLEKLGIDATGSGNAALETAKDQLEELKDLRDVVKDILDDATDQYEVYKSLLTGQLDRLQTMSESLGVISQVPEILGKLPAALAASVKGEMSAPILDPIENLYRTMLGKGSDAEGHAFWTAQLNSGAWSMDQIKAFFANTDLYKARAAYQLDGSHANGLGFVPFNGYRAELHYGERVLTAEENRDYSGYSVPDSNAAMATEMRNLQQQVSRLEQALERQTAAVVQSQYDATNRAAEKVVEGTEEAVQNAAWKEKTKPRLE
jgi:hypothetical protein